MKRVILTVGPRGSGKSTFCEKVIAIHPEVVLVSRDAILLEMFGSVELSPYAGDHYIGKMRMWEIAAEYLKREDITIILDCWNGFARERYEITTNLRKLGAEVIEAWYFVTPEETVIKWTLEREPVKSGKWAETTRRMRADSCHHDYQLFHSQPVKPDQGFNAIHRINPLRLTPDAAPL